MYDGIYCLCYLYVPTYPRRNHALFMGAPTQSCFCKKPTQIFQKCLGCFHHPTLGRYHLFICLVSTLGWGVVVNIMS